MTSGQEKQGTHPRYALLRGAAEWPREVFSVLCAYTMPDLVRILSRGCQEMLIWDADTGEHFEGKGSEWQPVKSLRPWKVGGLTNPCINHDSGWHRKWRFEILYGPYSYAAHLVARRFGLPSKRRVLLSTALDSYERARQLTFFRWRLLLGVLIETSDQRLWKVVSVRVSSDGRPKGRANSRKFGSIPVTGRFSTFHVLNGDLFAFSHGPGEIHVFKYEELNWCRARQLPFASQSPSILKL